MPEVYQVKDLRIEIKDNNTAVLTREDVTMTIVAEKRMDLLRKIGDEMHNSYEMSFGSIMGFYNVVPIREK